MSYYWPLPAASLVSQPFGSAPNNGFNPAGGHTGTDFAVPTGTPVRAAASGVIEHAGWVAGPYSSNPWWLTDFGGIVVVLNPGAGKPTFVYAHLSDTALNVGDRVSAGQVIGHSGNTGTATSGPHLHFEALPDGYDLGSSTYGRVNPARFCDTYYTGSTINPAGSTSTMPQEPFTMGQYEELMRQIGLAHEKENNIAAAVVSGFKAGRVYHGQTHGKINALTSIVEQLARGQGVTIDMAAVEAAAKKGAAEALAGFDADKVVDEIAERLGKDAA